jgi:hypothetical protein
VEAKLQELLTSAPMKSSGQLHALAYCPGAVCVGGHSPSAGGSCEGKNFCTFQESMWKGLTLYVRRPHYFMCSLVDFRTLYEKEIVIWYFALKDALRNQEKEHSRG